VGQAKNKDANRVWLVPLMVFATTVASVAEATVPFFGQDCCRMGTKGRPEPFLPMGALVQCPSDAF
jgi:hypothetical protein